MICEDCSDLKVSWAIFSVYQLIMLGLMMYFANKRIAIPVHEASSVPPSVAALFVQPEFVLGDDSRRTIPRRRRVRRRRIFN